MPDYSFQDTAVDMVLDKIKTNKSVLLQAPTGAGKTIMATRLARELPKPLLFLSERREIVRQTIDKFESESLDVGVLDADTSTYRHTDALFAIKHNITIGSQRTVWSRGVRKGHKIGDYKTIITDEAHHSLARTYKEIYKLYPDAKHVGLTATPANSLGNGYGNIFDTMVQGEDYGGNYSHLVEKGVLCPCPPEKIWTWPQDFKGVKVQMGDYSMGGKKGADKVMNRPKLIGDIVQHWLELNSERTTLAFCTSVAHAENLAVQFQREDISAECVHAGTEKEERDRILNELRKGHLQVVTNFGVLTEGFDAPIVDCIILARPTKQFHLYLQIVGRGLRSHPGKKELSLQDHTGIVTMHGIPGLDVLWTLDSRKKAGRVLERDREKKIPKPCPECGFILIKKECKSCGYSEEIKEQARPYGHDHEKHDTTITLANLDSRKQVAAPDNKYERDRLMEAEWYRLKEFAKNYDFKEGWVAYQFKDIFGIWPPVWLQLPDPRTCEEHEYFWACQNFAAKRNWKPAWANVQFNKVYNRWPSKWMME